MELEEQNKIKRPVGRPSDYSKEISDLICSEIAQGFSLRTICKSEDMPSIVTIFSWMRKFPDFLKQYEKAKQEQADALAEEIVDIADNGTNDWMQREDPDNPGYAYNGEHVQRSRLRVDARKWVASKLKPKKYGDKQEVEHSGSLNLVSLVEDSLKPKNVPGE